MIRPAAIAAGVVAAGAIPRALLAAGALPPLLRPFVWSDVLHIWERSDGALPYWESYFEYPPLVGYLWILLRGVAPGATAFVIAWALIQIAFAAAIAAVLARAVGARAAVTRWSLLPQLALFGPLNFDLLAVAALVGALRLDHAGRRLASAGAIAAGTALKLFPGAALPTILIRQRSIAAAAAQLATFALVVAALYLPSAAAPFPSTESLRRYTVGLEPNLDSFWGIAFNALRGAGADPAGVLAVVTAVGLAATYLVLVLPAARRSPDPAASVGLAVVAVLVWSRLYSPQFSLWVLPFFALCDLPRRGLLLLVFADVAVFLTVYPLTLVPWTADDPAAGMLAAALAAAVAARHGALVVVGRDLWWRTRGSGAPVAARPPVRDLMARP